MDRFICCLGGGSSSKVVQDTSEIQQAPEPSHSSNSSGSIEIEGSSSLVTFEWQEIVDGTENFAITHVIGQGNFGKVYRCNFPRVDKIGAVKIHDNHEDLSGLGEFVAEIRTLHAADHPNVIKIFGKHFGDDETALIYEFMPNGSLDHHLFDARQSQGLTQATRVLDWDTRMRIAVGVAEGLVYVHQGLSTIHRDVNVANILLDDDFVPKLTSFGSATKIDYNEDGVERQKKMNTRGTQGYIAPEVEELALVSTKSDVYNYGIFLLVLFTGRKAYDLARPIAKLTDWLIPVWGFLEYASLVLDVSLGKKYSVEGLNKILHTARMCINAQSLARPDMDFVETMVREAAAFPVQVVPRVEERRSSDIHIM